MQGTRLPDGFDEWPAPKGSYWKTKDGLWMCVTPNGRLGNLSQHTVVEHDDGTITVTPSILVDAAGRGDKPSRQAWHGFLERGVWREV